MKYAKKLILHAPDWESPKLAEFVNKCLDDEVALVCVVGPGCEIVHDIIDELVVGDGSIDRDGPITTWHASDTLDEVIEFARMWTVEDHPDATVEEVKL